MKVIHIHYMYICLCTRVPTYIFLMKTFLVLVRVTTPPTSTTCVCGIQHSFKYGISFSYPSASSRPSLVTKYVAMQIWAILFLALALHATINCPDSICLAQCLLGV